MERPLSPRAQSAAVLLPVLGVFLLMPPFITLFMGPARPLGIPLIVAYVFGVWAALLIAAAVLARRLRTPKLPGEAQIMHESDGQQNSAPPV